MATSPYAAAPRTTLQSFSQTSLPSKNDIWKQPRNTAAASTSNPTLPDLDFSDDFFGTTSTKEENPFTRLRTPKVPGFDQILSGSAADLVASGQRTAGDIANFRSDLERTRPAVEGYLGSDVGEIGNVFAPGGYEAQMAAIRARRKAAMGGVEGVLLGDLRRTLGLGAIGRAGAGLGSYLTSHAAAQGARIRAQAEADAAEAERRDLDAIMQARAGQLGRRQTLTDLVAQRRTLPITAEGARNRDYEALLSSALQNAINNSELTYSLGSYQPTTLPGY